MKLCYEIGDSKREQDWYRKIYLWKIWEWEQFFMQSNVFGTIEK